MNMQEKLERIKQLDLQAVAVAASVAALATELGVEITDERAGRGLLWLVEQRGKAAVAEAVASLVGSQHAYPLNLARRMGIQKLTPPGGPSNLAALLRISVRSELASQERERQVEADAAARRTANLRIAP